VTARSENVFEVEDLMPKTVSPVHSTRLRFYHEPSLEVTADIHAHLAHQNQGYEVYKLLDLRYDAESKEFQAQVSWLGFDEAENTWEPLISLHEDIPSNFLNLLAHLPDRDLAQRARAVLP
jgi:hypothetical protein